MDPERWRRVDELLQRALELRPERRSAFLDHVCAGDTDLRREVQSLIDSHDEAGSFLETAPAKTGEASPPLVGQTIGRYRILSFLGAGGMGRVYLAQDPQLGRTVALKLLPPEATADKERLGRFEQEARAASALNHPNIITIYEIGRDEGLPYIATEFIDGRTLRAQLADPLALPEVIEIVLQVGLALGAAHNAGIVHRDIKPENIMIRCDGYVKIVDFGVAKLPRPVDAIDAPVTTAGALVGTVRYMSPEQLRGFEVDSRTDLFSLGVVLYEMIAGRAPFSGVTTSSTIASILESEPAPLAEGRPEVPAELERIVRKAICKKREERYANALELVSDLKAFKEAPAAEDGAKSRYDAASWKRRSAVLSLLVLTLVLSWAGYRVWQLRHSPGLSQAVPARRAVAVLGFKNLSAQGETEWVSTALSEMLTTELAAGGKLRTIPGETVARMKRELALASAESFAPDTLARIRSNLGAGVVVLGSYFSRGKEGGGAVRWDLVVQDAARGETLLVLKENGTESELPDLVSRAGTRLREKLGAGVLSPDEEGYVRASYQATREGTQLYAEGLAKLRLSEPLAARDLLEKSIAVDPASPLAQSALAAAWYALGYDEKAKLAARKALDLASSLSRDERLLIEGRYYQTSKDWPRAIEIYRSLFSLLPDDLEHGLRLASVQTTDGKARDALATAESLRRLPQPVGDDLRIDLAESRAALALSDFKRSAEAAARGAQKARVQGAQLLLAQALSLEANALRQLGKASEAREALEQARQIFESLGDQFWLADTLNGLGVFYWDQGKLAEAKSAYSQSLNAYRKIGNVFGVGSATQNIAIVLYDKGDLGEARSMYEQALAAFREAGSKRGISNSLNGIANVLADQGDYEGAMRTYNEGMAVARDLGERRNVAVALCNIGILQAAQGDLSGALKSFQEAAGIERELGSKRILAYALTSMGDTLLAHGEPAQARKVLEEALAIRKQPGQDTSAAETRLSLAALLIEEGQAEQAEAEAHAAREIFRKSGKMDLVVSANGVLARALLAQSKASQAEEAIGEAQKLLVGSKNRVAGLATRIAEARVLSARGRMEAARRSLRTAIEETGRSSLRALHLEARLALAELERKSGDLASARRLIAALETEARMRGFELIARKAASLKE